MLQHFLFFVWTDFRNQLRRRLARLRNPRYAIALLVGVAYFFFVFGGPALFGGPNPASRPRSVDSSLIATVGGLYIALLATWWWLGGSARNALAFRPPEANFLLTAPLTRAQLITFKLMRAQIPIVFTALFVTLISRRVAGPWWLRYPSAWVMLSTLHLHQIGAGLVHTSALMHGRSGWRRVRVPLLVFTLALGSVLWPVGRVLARARAPSSSGVSSGVLGQLGAALQSPPANVVLAPFRMILAPLSAATVTEWLPAFGIALLILAAHYFWVLRSDVAFEESAAEAGEKVAKMVEALRAGRTVAISGKRKAVNAPWFPLRSTGEPAVAIAWKNVLFFTRHATWGVPILAALAALLLGGLTYFDERKMSQAMAASGGTLLALGGALLMLGPVFIRSDLRSDLRKIELLRTLPLDGTRMVAAQLAGSAVPLCMIQLGLLAPGLALVLVSGLAPHALIIFLAACGFTIALPALNAIAVAIQNALVLLLPAWSNIGTDDHAGIERMGQQLLSLFAAVVLLAIALVPPALFAAATGAYFLRLGSYAAIPAALAFIGVMYWEVFLFVQWLGGMYERLDPVEAGLCR